MARSVEVESAGFFWSRRKLVLERSRSHHGRSIQKLALQQRTTTILVQKGRLAQFLHCQIILFFLPLSLYLLILLDSTTISTADFDTSNIKEAVHRRAGQSNFAINKWNKRQYVLFREESLVLSKTIYIINRNEQSRDDGPGIIYLAFISNTVIG